MARTSEIKRYRTSCGHTIYRLTLEAFHEFWTFVYLVLLTGDTVGVRCVLIDTGSGYGRSNQDLEEGLMEIAQNEKGFQGWEDLTHILITHGHIDHFGGLPYVRSRTPAQVGIHELDRRTVTQYDERLARVSQKLKGYLLEAGLDESDVNDLINIYRASKLTYEDVPIDFTYDQLDMRLGPFHMLHVPGHCPGHIVLQLDGVLFCGDHILPDISPHQAPECLTLNTGLDHYLASLSALRAWANGVEITLTGHGGDVIDLERRIHEIEGIHRDRFQRVLDFMDSPHTVKDTALKLFGEVHGYQGYNRLLALEEAGAHIEYLYLRGLIKIANLDEIQATDRPVPIYYARTKP